VTYPNDAAGSIQLAINVMAAYVVGDDANLSWAKVEDTISEEQGTFRLLQGFIGLTGLLLQQFEFSIDPPVRPETMLQRLADLAREQASD
jgi:hypothetical protein